MRQATLFASADAPRTLVAARGDVRYYPEWLAAGEATALLDELRELTRFRADTRLMYGKRVAVPREQAVRGEGREQPWTPRLLAVRRDLEALLATEFDYVLVNRYRDGCDSVAWHGDHEDDPRLVIGSLSLGATREFGLRPKPVSGLRPHAFAVDLGHGDLVVMAGETQRCWEHRVRKDPHVFAERINLTFRQQRPR